MTDLDQAFNIMNTAETCVLGTTGEDGPLCSLMACRVAETAAGRRAVHMLTSAASGKFRNIQADPRVSLLFDTRDTVEGSVHTSRAVTANGSCRVLEGGDHGTALGEFLRRHPHLQGLAGGDGRILHVELHTVLYLPSPLKARFFDLR